MCDIFNHILEVCFTGIEETNEQIWTIMGRRVAIIYTV